MTDPMRRVFGVAVVALISTACSSEQPAVVAQHAPPAITASNAIPDATPMATPSLSSTPSPTCPPPWGVCTESTAIGNFDGTGQKEAFSASPIRAGSNAVADWQLEVRLADGRNVSARLSGLIAARAGCPAIDGSYAIVLGAANFAGPSRDLALVEINHGASTRSGIMVGIEGGSLRLATVASGAERCQRVFPFSGSVTHGNGVACGWRNSTPVMWVRQVADYPPRDYAHYDWYQATYAWQGLQLYLLSLEHAVITGEDARFGPSYAVACGSISIRG
jgi:hypothetical protein